MRAACFSVLLITALLWGGGQGIYEGIRYRQPQVVTYEQFVKAKPRKGWFRIQGAVLDLPQGAFVEQAGRLVRAYLPVRSGRAAEGGRIQLLFSSEHPAILQTGNEMLKISPTAGDAQVREFVRRNGRRLWMACDLEGMVAWGIEASTATKEKIARLSPNLAKDFIILEEGRTPALGRSILFFGLGITALLVLGIRAIDAGARR